MLGLLIPMILSAAGLHAEASAFVLKPDFKGPCQASPVVDVNLGHTPETFVQACWCQLTGKAPDSTMLKTWSERLRKEPTLRRIDVVRTLAQQAGKSPKLSYSNPWSNDPELAPAGPKKGKRDIGAVLMFFFQCPGGVNCGMDWANNHVEGMQGPSPLLANKGKPGYYQANNIGFWRHELRDAKAAGLDFVLANVYGPDMAKDGQVKVLAQALAAEAEPVKVALLDDTWPWGEQWFGPAWQLKPDFNDPARASSKLYEAKWKPFFTQVPKKDWYLVNGRPLIYFYNAGKLNPLNLSSATIRRMKARFKKDFGVEPFVAADRAYFADPDMQRVADARFIWDTLGSPDCPDKISQVKMNGKVLAHAITRWDSMGRDKGGAIAGPADRIFKGPELLEAALAKTVDADILVLGTWNDLGEGTGLNRAYDYWYQGRWLAPDHFINILRQARER